MIEEVLKWGKMREMTLRCGKTDTKDEDGGTLKKNKKHTHTKEDRNKIATRKHQRRMKVVREA